MALTTEQQAEIQLEVDRQKFKQDAEIEAGIYISPAELVRNRMELVRIAKEVLAENERAKPVDERGLDANAITTFASTLASYVNG